MQTDGGRVVVAQRVLVNPMNVIGIDVYPLPPLEIDLQLRYKGVKSFFKSSRNTAAVLN